MRMVVGSILLFLCAGSPLISGESSLAIPLLDRSAAAAASGEAGAFLAGLDAVAVNPAGLAEAQREWNANYRQMPLDTTLNGMAFAQPIRSLRTTVAVSYSALRSINLERRGLDGHPSGEFRHEEQILGFHVARPFRLGEKIIDVGAGVKSIQARIDTYSGTGLAMDFGVRTRLSGIPLTLSASVLNVGEGPTLITEKAELPTSYGVSVAFQPHDHFTVLGGAAIFPNQNISNATCGVEYGVGDLLSFRGHYALGTGTEGRTGWGQLVGGLGLNLGRLRLDYAFQPAGDELSEAGAPATQHATLTFAF